MAQGFLSKLPGGLKVTARPTEKDWGGIDEDSPPKGVGHTTETNDLPTYGPGQQDAPTFTIGTSKVWQHRKLLKGCGTLKNDRNRPPQTNTVVRIQFELVGHATTKSWLPDSTFQVDALAAIKQLAKDELDVPMDHVWPDKQDGGSGTIGKKTYPRRQSKFPDVPGWYCHGEIPENDHWDWGSLKWDDLDAGAGLVEALAFVERFKNENGKWRTREISPFFANRAALRDWAVVPDGSNLDTDDDLRRSLFDAMCENRVWVAKRRVAEDEIDLRS